MAIRILLVQEPNGFWRYVSGHTQNDPHWIACAGVASTLEHAAQHAYVEAVAPDTSNKFYQ